MERGKYVVVSKSGGTPFSQVKNDCDTGFCFPVGQGDSLSTVFKKLCNYINSRPITETDPVFSASAAFGITTNLISNWNAAFSWGNPAGLYAPISHTHPLADIEQSNASTGQVIQWNGSAWVPITPSGDTGIESDPIFTSWLGSNPNISLFVNDSGYLTSYTETDPIWTAAQPNYSTTSQADLLYYPLSANPANYITLADLPPVDPIFWGDISGTLSNQTDLQSALNAKQGNITTGTNLQYFRGDLTLATFPTNLSAFTNGPGYITSYTETDPVWTAASSNYRTFSQNNSLYYPLSSNPAGYLTTFSEIDPVFSAWLATPPNISIFTNDTGYITSYTDTNLGANDLFQSSPARTYYIDAQVLNFAGNGGVPIFSLDGSTFDWILGDSSGNNYITGSSSIITLNSTKIDYNGNSLDTTGGLATWSGVKGLDISTFNNDSGYITSSSLSPYLLSSTATSTYTPLTRTISTTAPLSGGGDLSANRTLSIPKSTISLDGYLAASDFTIFNNKVTSLSGTTNRITIGGTTTVPTVDISASYVGQTSITTLGTITSGTWGAGTISQLKGGTGFTTYTAGDILYSPLTNTLGKLPIGSTNQVLTVIAGLPSWQPASTPTGQALTKTDDTNVTLTLGGSPTTALLAATSLTLGWTGTLADARIASAAAWNAKQAALSGTGIVKSTAGTISYLTDNSTNWDTAYTNRITSLTTTGSGAATLIANVLNIPTPSAATFSSLTTTGSSGSSTLISGVLNVPSYTLAGLGGITLSSLSATSPIFYNNVTGVISSQAATTSLNGYLTSTDWNTFNGKQAALSGTGFVKSTAGVISYDTNTYITGNQSITLSGDVTGSGTTAITTAISNTIVTGKVLTGYVSGAGTVAATDSILQAIQKLNGNDGLKVTSVSGTASRITSTGGTTPVLDISSSYVGQSSITTLGTIGTGIWQGTAIVDTYISSASIWNAKQTALSGTGFVKIVGTTISYDNNTYLTTSSASSTYQPLDSDLTAIAALTTDSFGLQLLTKTSAANIRTYIGVGTGTGDALVANPLSQFAATTSAQLAGVISDETGSGALVFGTAPTLSNPIVGTQSANDNSTKAASTAYVDTADALKVDKSQAAYTMQTNNTNATANMAATTFKEIGQQTLANTGFVWTGTTPPSGTETHNYRWHQIGKLVFLHVKVQYTSPATGITGFAMPFPSDIPKPYVPTGTSAASDNLYIGNGRLMVSSSTVPAATNIGLSVIRANAANTDYEIYVTGTSGTHRVIIIDIMYMAV